MKFHFGIMAGAAAMLLPFAVSCGGAHRHPEKLNAAQHREEAVTLEEQAVRAEGEYDPGAAELKRPAAVRGLGVQPGENPTEYNLRLAERHRRHAAQHRAAAEALQGFEDAQCAAMATSEAEICPLLIGVAEVAEIPGGVRLTVDAKSSVDQLYAQARCHVAFGEAFGESKVPSCALYVPGVHLTKSSVVAVELTVDDPTLVRELRERASEYGNR